MNNELKKRFIDLLLSTKRQGIENLISYLDRTDFFIAPASTQYHGAKPGGLLEHSIAVYEKICKLKSITPLCDFEDESLILISLLHDLCKVNFYELATRNVKNEQTERWEKQTIYKINDKFPFGHGEKSVFIINRFIELNIDEIMAIRWHMGAWSAESYNERQILSTAMNEYPLILLLQMADLAATYFDKK